MGFVKTDKELEKYFELSVRKFPGAEILGIMYETEPEIVARVLPPPLEPAMEPWALCFIAHYPVTNLGPGYNEGAIFVRCRFQEEVGNYCLSMPIDDEARMHNGRDIYGFPKKLAKIRLKRDGKKVEGSIERFGHRFVTLRADLMNKMDQLPMKIGPNFLFKYSPSAELGRGFDGPVSLVRQKTEIEMESFEMGSGEVIFQESPHDPWSEIKV
ncbi:MAG: acetoacetate decarboxylase family protein, partial [Desulfobulbaceae bacterium]|nr:acetoacetate decarboxylase family protein [Desulfobulbaceae bacterium]